MLLKERIRKELDRIKEENGTLTAEAVVKFAEDENTALHGQFEWSDGKAAHKWRLHQARHLIILTVTVVDESTPPVRAFVSLRPDRNKGNGYRGIEDVLSDKDMTAIMLEDALGELQRLRLKYSALEALAGVWQAVDQVKSKPKRKRRELRVSVMA